MMRARIAAWLICIVWLCSCTSTASVQPAFISFRLAQPENQAAFSLYIDANGYVVRTIERRTDEFVLSKTDFATLLNQLDTVAFDRIAPLSDEERAQYRYYTITYQTHQIQLLEHAVPPALMPLMITFRRIIDVQL
jgi:hypothetical protein